MQLTFREVEKAFEIEEKTLYQWLNSYHMPAVKANDQYYFNSVEVLEWALKNHIPLTPGTLKFCERNQSESDIFTPALKRGGVHYAVKGHTREEALTMALDLLPLPQNIQKPFLKTMLLSREQLGTTGIGNGIAIPHVKHPVVFMGLEPVVGLFFLERPIDFLAIDGKNVHTLFVIMSASFKGHLSLLSRLALCLQDSNVANVLSRKGNLHEVMAAFHLAEGKVRRVD